MRIPLSALNVSQPKAGMEWRANFYRATGLGDDDKRKFLAWKRDFRRQDIPRAEHFGILRLVK